MTTSEGAVVKAEPWKDPTARPYVQVDRISKSFGDFKAVDDVSLKIYQGEIFCLLGASGCGKTTLRNADLRKNLHRRRGYDGSSPV
jgi:putrescine transport system ATP-binding protein